MYMYDELPTLVIFNGVPVKVRREFWPLPVIVWAALAVIGVWRWPGQSPLAYVLIGGVGLLLAMPADVGHACAHTISAKMVHAPMAIILLGADMPRTLYPDAPVRPGQHIGRSLGGPIYSWICVGIGLLALQVTMPHTAWRYLAEIWTVANAFIGLAILAPLPIVDGGVIVKWLLVIGGQDEAHADRIVRWMDIALAVLLLIGAVVAVLLASWIVAVALLILSVIVILAVTKTIQ